MIETTKESDYLLMLAHWFDQMELQGRLNGLDFRGQEVAAHLERIAEKLRLLEAHDHIKNQKKYGPKSKDHPSIGNICQACRKKFKEGDITTLISLGPGDDEEEMEKCRKGKFYNGVGIEVHYSCATGIKNV